jgi:hypothetical protein
MEGRTKDGREDKGWKGGQRMEGRTKERKRDAAQTGREKSERQVKKTACLFLQTNILRAP